MSRNTADRRGIMKTIASAAVAGTGVFVTSREAAAAYDHEVVVTNEVSGGVYTCEVPYNDGVDFSKWEVYEDTLTTTDGGDRVQAKMKVDGNSFAEGKDIFYWNGDLSEFQTIRYDSGVRVEVDGELIAKNEEYPFR